MPMVNTPNELKYQFFPVQGGCFTFKVRAGHDAHLCLVSQPTESDPMYEVFIGGWENSKSVIRRNRQKPDVVEVPTPGILDDNEFRGFWVRWYDNEITVGREGDNMAMMSFRDPQLFPVNYIGICTGWGASGSWDITDTCSAGGGPQMAYAVAPPMDMGFNPGMGGAHGTWVPASNGQVPPNAVEGGFDGSEPLFIARASHDGEVIPGKLLPGHGVCYVPYGGGEHPHQQYEVLCNAYGRWEAVVGNNVPQNAIPGGQCANGEILLIGRASHGGAVTPGKVQPSHGCCYIPYGGEEVAMQSYEVYVSN